MSSRIVYAIIGLLIGAAVDLLINLLAAAAQQRVFFDQFNDHSVWWLVGLTAVGLLMGYWLGEKLELTISETTQTKDVISSKVVPKTVSMTRLRAFFSYTKLRGKGIHLSDLVLIGSRIVVDTRED